MVKKNNLRKIFAAFACISCAALGAAAFAACDSGNDDSKAGLSSGTYWAEAQTTSMGGLTYVVHITLDAEENTYYFSSYYVMDNAWAHATYVNNESGTYTDDGTSLVFKTEGKDDLTATISEDSFVLDKDVAGMGMNTYELTYEMGSAPVYVTYFVDGAEYNKVGYKNSTDAVLAIEEPEKGGYTFAWGTVPETAGSGASVYGTFSKELVSGSYDVDITWSPMYEHNPNLEYHVNINSAEMTFEVLSGTTGKGSGTITYDDGVYTLNYANENKTTFTYDADSKTITFTSKLWINTIPLNRVDDDGEFKSYNAEFIAE